MSVDVAKLRAEMRAGLEGVTPGPWEVAAEIDGQETFTRILAGKPVATTRPQFGRPHHYENMEGNAAHIARCSPLEIKALLDALDAAERERDEARADFEREADWTRHVEAIGGIDEFDAAADRWLSMPTIGLMHNAAASVFSKWANDELMGRFKQHMTNIMHQSFVEGAIVGHRAAWNKAERERDEALKKAEQAVNTLDAWFDLAEKTEAEGADVLNAALETCLKRASNGGMPAKHLLAARAIFTEATRTYLWRALVPVLRGMADEARAKALEEAAAIVRSRIHRGNGAGLNEIIDSIAVEVLSLKDSQS